MEREGKRESTVPGIYLVHPNPLSTRTEYCTGVRFASRFM